MSEPEFADPIALYHVVREAWSEETCISGYDPKNRCKNQCSVTALAVHHFFGGEIVKTATKGGTHFYNRIGGAYWDLAADQFDEPIPYTNLDSSPREALADTSQAHFSALLRNIAEQAAEHEASAA
jgi:hypothetical protein